ncbi:TonB-dependent copper receptor [Chromobacterium sp. TRC.1.1.SA]|uniref:TonB-dependent copper receptor n=1 Tax=Chromobacterium indicum TaxID=3110228 RepID=A0ABV0CHJ1_9NEIS
MTIRYLLPLPLALAVAHACAAETPAFVGEEVLVTASRLDQPLQLSLDPRAPRQPAPAADGASLLKNIPGFNVARKGGSSGDPLLRGLGGSRLAILADGGFVFGGCGGRMDPPTAYLFPDAYDVVEVVKGPQSVKLGPGLVAGGVNFERKTPRFDQPGVRFNGSLLGGSGDRNDAYADFAAGSRYGYARILASRNHGGDYRDGDGRPVHSAFDRDSQTAIVGLTPGRDTTLEVSADRSRGQAAYADRMMDGSKFDRDAWGVKLEQRRLAGWLDAVRLQLNHSYVDHVMDNFSLRPAPKMKMLGNPDREADTGRLSADLAFGDWEVTTGVDWLRDRHSKRFDVDYQQQPRLPDISFDNQGLYAEASTPLGAQGRLIAGLRRDATLAVQEAASNGGVRAENRYHMDSGFVRYELKTGGWTHYVGLGQAQRAPDYWELNRNDGLGKESNLQLDAGLLYQDDKLQGSLSAYLSRVGDFILVDNNSPQMARNVDARRYGLESEARWRFAPQWTLSGSVAWVWAANLDNGRPLAQTPPLEGKLGLKWDNGRYGASAALRAAQRQDRVAPGQGNIVGQDIGTAPGFATLSLDAGWKISKRFKLLAGIDNVFNRNYAESVSRGGDMVAGYTRTTRVNEPGRTLWTKLQVEL